MAGDKRPSKSSSRNVQRRHVRRVMTNKGPKNVIVNPTVRGPAAPSRPNNNSKPKDPIPGAPLASRPRLQPNIHPTRAEQKELDDFSELLIAAAKFKKITFSGGEAWAAEPLVNRIPFDRILQLKRSPSEFAEFATDSEALLYLSTMSLVAPPDSDVADMMTYLFNQVYSDVPDDLKSEGLSERLMVVLKRLKRDIRKSQWKAFRGDVGGSSV